MFLVVLSAHSLGWRAGNGKYLYTIQFHLHYFLTVAREQSISAAAESLHISQPALSTQLKGMEAELGKQLLIRGTKGSRKVVLTEEGMILRRRAEEILSLVQKAEEEITRSDETTIVGDVVIGAGETDSVRLLAQAARELQKQYPDIHYHISSGNAEYVLEYLDKGLIDFGLLFREPDPKKYEWLALPAGDIWGVLMRRDAPLARKVAVCPEDLWDLPLITSHQKGDDHRLAQWMGREISELNVVATYNLVFNASLLVDEGLGYALCFDKLIHTEGTSLCFRPFSPTLEAPGYIVWKKYQIFSKAAGRFLQTVRERISDGAHGSS